MIEAEDSRIQEAFAPRRRRLAPFIVPTLGLALVAIFFWGLQNSTDDLPSTRIGKPVPEFDLEPVLGREIGLSSDDLIGEVSLVNFFASWCVSCKLEHPVFLELSARNVVPLYGIDYKDQPEDAEEWLEEVGDPYTLTGADIDGRVGIEWGVYGLPETFIVDRESRIVYRHVGAISAADLEECLLPIVERLRASEFALSTINLPSACQRTSRQIDLKSNLQTKS